ncbi:class E sortase [Actinokineospora fastidiosa]|uniref:class E sortase n=1 Tax=Actinokineospora fastidiosa TaxID=1816 RepID=UPI001E336292|nr:class E sortase [Actinokineospora fastidiosa]
MPQRPQPTERRPQPTGVPSRPRPAALRPHPAEAPTEVIRPLTPQDAPTEVIRPVLPPRRPAPVDPPTEFVEPEYDDYPDDEDDYADDDYDDPPPPKPTTGAVVVRSIGELMVTAGLVILLFVVYEVWITDLMSAQKQADVTADLDRQWEVADDPEREQKFEYADGEGIAKLYIPVFGPDYHFTVVEGTSAANLEVGPGHYTKSAPPGQPGNFAVAGHRVGKGAPFNDLDLLNPCDAIVIETQTDWFVYRMLPTSDQPVDPADPRCKGVEAQEGEYAAAVGRRIVTPDKGEVVLPVPGNADAQVPKDQLKRMMTLTTCHPKFSNAQRMIVHAVLVREQPKGDDLPPELSEG